MVQNSIDTASNVSHRIATCVVVLLLPAFIAWLYQATHFSIPFIGHFSSGLTFFDAAIAALIVARTPFKTSWGWPTISIVVACFFSGWSFYFPVQNALANKSSFSIVENGRIELGISILHLMNLAIAIWLFTPIHQLLSQMLASDHEILDRRSIRITTIMAWTAGAALILASNRWIAQYGEPYHISHSASTAEFLLSCAIQLVSVSAVTSVLMISSTTWFRVILGLPLAAVVVFTGLSTVAGVSNVMATGLIGPGSLLGLPTLDFLAFSAGQAFVLWIAVASARLTAPNCVSGRSPIPNAE